MAHLVETMAYVGQTPWHGLGHQLPAEQPLQVWSKAAGMDWDILDTPVRFITGQSGSLGAIEAFEERRVLYRSDTHAPLSIVSDRFKIVQPREVLEFYRDLTEHAGFELETAGILQGGRKFWALAHTGQTDRIKGNDQSRGYVLLASSCDGSFATTAQFTHVRVVCNNTLSAALDDQTGAVKVPHRSVFDPVQVKRELGISVSIWSGFMDQLKALADRKVKNAEVERFFNKVFTVTRYDPKPVQVVHEKAANHAMSLFNGNGMGSSFASSKGTAYGLLNAVTEYVDHHRPARSDDNRLNAAWFGEGAAIKDRALKTALDLVA